LSFNVAWDSACGRPIDLSFFMTNVTDSKRLVRPFATYQTTGAQSVYLDQPRIWGFRLKDRFGD
jgi:iron complex outermembrane receptor protein